jgi:hypothetical protein
MLSLSLGSSVRRRVDHASVGIGLGALLTVAAALKMHTLAVAPSTFRTPLLSETRTAVPLILSEWAFGVWLISGFQATAARVIAILLFSIFSLVAAFHLVSGMQACDCFGNFAVPPSAMLLFNATATLLLIRNRPPRHTAHGTRHTAHGTRHTAHSESRYVQLLRTLVVSLTSFSTMASFSTIVFGASDVTFLGAHGKIIGSSVHVNVDVAAWEGLPCPLIPHIVIDKPLEHGEWTLFIYRGGCAKCERALVSVLNDRKRGAYNAANRLAIVHLDSHLANPRITNCVQGYLSSDYVWHLKFPIIMHLAHGRVLAIQEPT